MILSSNFINIKNHLTIDVVINLDNEKIFTTVTGFINGNYLHYRYYNFKKACKKFKKLNKTLKNEVLKNG